MKQVFYSLLLVLLPLASNAVGITVPASADLFPCNAGLQHAGGVKSCFTPQGAACDPQKLEACICTSSSGLGDYLLGTIAQSGQVPFDQTLLPGASSYSPLLTFDKIFLGQVQNIQFNLGSESYGAKYFVQLCYRGPVAQLTPGGDLSQGLYNLRLTLTGGSEAYKKKVLARYSYSCDLRAQGAFTVARPNSVLSPGATMEVDSSGAVESAVAGGLSSASFNLNSSALSVPRFCVFNLELRETTTGPRENSKNGGQFNLNAEVTKLVN